MPVSKKRARRKPRPVKRRDKGAEARAKETQVAQAKAASVKKLTPSAYRRQRILGWSLVGLALFIFVTHLLEHLQIIKVAPQGVEDLLIGFPMAALLGIAAAIILGR